MTNNQIKLREVKEKERANRESELIEKLKVQISEGTLSETIRNNLRNYRINLDKNDIQRLANDQLDDRERKRIAETIRDNLVKEVETNRHNLQDEEIRRAKNAIDSLKTKYDAGSLIAAALGLMPENEQVSMYGQVITLADVSDAIAKVKDMGNKPTLTNEYTAAAGKGGPTSPMIPQSKNKKLSWDEKIPKSSNFEKKSGGGTRGIGKKKDDDEIPTDFSSSKGPDNVVVEQPSVSYPSNSGNAQVISTPSSNYNDRTSGGTDYQIRGGHKSSGVIYAPGAN